MVTDVSSYNIQAEIYKRYQRQYRIKVLADNDGYDDDLFSRSSSKEQSKFASTMRQLQRIASAPRAHARLDARNRRDLKRKAAQCKMKPLQDDIYVRKRFCLQHGDDGGFSTLDSMTSHQDVNRCCVVRVVQKVAGCESPLLEAPFFSSR